MTIFITPNLDSILFKQDIKHNLSELINDKIYTVANTPLSYRQINTLSKDNLFPEERTGKKGWRKFSLKDLIFFHIIYELKKFGLQHDAFKDLSDSFFKEPTQMGKLEINKHISDIAIGCVLIKAEIMLTINDEGKIAYYDPPHYLLIGREETPVVQIRINDIVNTINEKNDNKLIPINWSGKNFILGKKNIGISDKEEEVINLIRNNDYTTLKIKKTDGQISLIHAEKNINTDQLSKQEIMGLIEAKDFQDIGIIKRNGNIVSLKIEESIKL